MPWKDLRSVAESERAGVDVDADVRWDVNEDENKRLELRAR
jgi:hypothetical protein